MAFDPTNPLIIQSDRSILLEVDNPKFEEARDFLSRFAEIIKSPEYVHTYSITPLSLWNAASAGMTAEEIIEGLKKFSKYPVPSNVIRDIKDYISRYGRVKIIKENDEFYLKCDSEVLADEIWSNKKTRQYLIERIDDITFIFDEGDRGFLKQALVEIGYPAEDLAGYVEGEYLDIELRKITRSGKPFELRDYQKEAAEAFYAGGSVHGGSGVIVLPCGAGKTIVGLAAMALVKSSTLILATNLVAVRQWISEIIDKTTIDPSLVGEYSGEKKEIKPITVVTYQVLTYHSSKDSPFEHLDIFMARNWGLIIYDEVHVLPAPIFRATAKIQATRRLGLTATLIREDGRESDVFSLIGPKKFDKPWKTLENQGWIAEAICHEIRVELPDELLRKYAVADDRNKYRIAAENPEKIKIVKKILEKHKKDNILIIGLYLSQLRQIAKEINAPIITGKTPQKERLELFKQFREGKIKVLVVSKVANFAIDLPDANVAIQISGTFGSRQEEAQRLGRILRPKEDGSQAHFYSIVTKDTKDMDFAAKRQLFLTEQGYQYIIQDPEALFGEVEES